MKRYSKAEAEKLILKKYPMQKFDCRIDGIDKELQCNILYGKLIAYEKQNPDTMEKTKMLEFEFIYLPI